MRILLVAALVCSVVVFAATALGRAIDTELEQRVIIPRDGQLLDCRRDFSGHGNVSYNDCHVVP